MPNIPKVSIITVVYNGISHLEQTIQSVLKQTYKNIEYIIIDGGSTDGTVELIKKYEEQIEYWVSEPDKGIYDAMNKGLSKATGKYIGLINADDWYIEDAIASIILMFKESHADVIYGDMQMLEEEQNLFVKKAVKSLSQLNKGMLINHPTVFAKLELYEKYGLFDTQYKIAADWEMMLRWWLQDVKFTPINKTLSHFRMGGVSSVHLKQTFEEKHQIRKKHNTFLLFDSYYLIDRFKKILPSEVLLYISLARQKRKED